jgi:hypothetical protein
MLWGGNWEVKLGFGQVPCQDILKVCIQVAERYTILEALDVLEKNGRELHKDGGYNKPTKVSLRLVVFSWKLADLLPLGPVRDGLGTASIHGTAGTFAPNTLTVLTAFQKGLQEGDRRACTPKQDCRHRSCEQNILTKSPLSLLPVKTSSTVLRKRCFRDGHTQLSLYISQVSPTVPYPHILLLTRPNQCRP